MRPSDVGILREALPYLHQFSGATFVIKIGGEIISHANMSALGEELAFLHRVGIRVVIVHGGGKQADDLLRRLGIEPKKVEGRRITDEATLEVAKMVFRGATNMELLSHLRRCGCVGVGLSGLDGRLITARRRPPVAVRDVETGRETEVDYGLVGDVVAVDVRVLATLLAAGFVPVVCSLGADESGAVLNINADTIASRIAALLRAEKLITLTNVGGVYRDLSDPQSRISHLSAREAEELITQGVVEGGMAPKLRGLIDALRDGVGRAHVIDGTRPDSLLVEVFTADGDGTMLTLADRLPDQGAPG
ncbi:MAG: acetylglutamate kinase [Planctomycetes bacterium]|nr:acetylglutamate kinase [Planctomycetota bacterium]